MKRFPTDLDAVDGARNLFVYFETWPSFHDAEIISLHLNRRGSSKMLVHTWRQTNEVDAKGFYVQDKHAVVEFTLAEISEIELNGCSSHNVLFSLAITEAPTGYTIEMDPSFGLGGKIAAKQISIALRPGMPADK